MPPRDYSRPPSRKPRRKASSPAPRSEAAGGGGYRKVSAPSVGRAPAPSFARPLGRADAAITNAQRGATRRAHRARRKIQSRTTVPYTPKLRRPTPRQRAAAVDLVRRSLGGQDIDRRALPREQRRRLDRALGYDSTIRRQVQASVGREALRQRAPLPVGYSSVGDTLFGPSRLPLTIDRERELISRLRTPAGPGLAAGMSERQLAAVGREVARANRSELTPGRGQPEISAMGFNVGLDDVWDATGGRLAAGFSSGVGQDLTRFLTDDVPGFAGRAGSDLVNLPKNAVLGMYALGDAGVSAAGGDWSKAGQLVEGFKQGALYNLLTGDFVEAERAISANPLYSALEVSGAGSAVGRTLGAGARVGGRAATLAGAEGNVLARAGSTVREPLRLGDTGQVVQRRYSPDLIRKGFQVAADRRREQRGEDPNVATGSRLTRELQRAADETAAQAEGMRRPGRARAQRAARRLEKRTPRRFRDLVQGAVEGEYRSPATFEKDLRAKYDRLQKAWEQDRRSMPPDAKRHNREQREVISMLLGDRKKLEQARARIFPVADEYRVYADEVEAELLRTGALDPEQARAAKLRTFAVAHMGARFSKRDGLVDGEGNKVTTKQIERHIAKDPEARMPAFVSHRPGVGGTSAHFVNWLGGRKSTEGKGPRTGEAARTGGQDPSFRALEDSLVRGQGIADAARNFDRYVADLGVKHPQGRMFTWEEAIDYNENRRFDADGNEIPGVVEMVPVRVVPASYDPQRAEAIIEGQGTAVHPDVGSITQNRIAESLRAPGAGERGAKNVVLVPKVQVDRLKEHQFSGTGEPGKVGQTITGAFRGTVLPFSTKWLTGNTVEAALRLSLNDTPLGLVASRRAGRKVMKKLEEIDAQAARELDVRATGGLLYGGQRTVYGGAERFTGTRYERAAKTAAALRRVPVVKQIGDAVGTYQRAVFAFNGKLEHYAQVTALGKEARREIQSVTGSWSKAARAQKAAVEDVARGLVGTPAQVRYARAVDETLGKYNKFSPTQRRMFQTIAPFAPWYLNSVRFLLHTLPVRHPVKTALLATVERTLEQEFEEQHKGVPPGSLEGAIPTGDGGFRDLARYTPFGLTADGAKAIVDPFIPQFSSVIQILNGNSWTGNKLRLQDGSRPGDGKKIAMALYAAIESVVPAVSVARRLQEGGETAFDDSTVFSPKTKPGTAGPDAEPSFGAALNRVFNPLRPTYLNPSSVPGGSSLPPAVEDTLRQIREGAQSRQVRQSVSPEAQAILDEIRRRASSG